MANKDGNPALDFIRQQLVKNPKVSYGEVAEAATKKGIKIFPIMYGRAKALEGLVKVSPRGEGKIARAKAGVVDGVAAAPRKRGRPRKYPLPVTGAQSNGAGLDGLGGLVEAVKVNAQERERYRNALQQIQSILNGALS